VACRLKRKKTVALAESQFVVTAANVRQIAVAVAEKKANSE